MVSIRAQSRKHSPIARFALSWRMQLRFLSDHRTRLWIVLALLVLLVAGLILSYFFVPGFGRRGSSTVIPRALPGLASDGRYDTETRVPGIWLSIRDRLTGPVPAGQQTVHLPFSAFTVTKTRTMDDAYRSTELVAEDILLYAQAMAEQGRRADFLSFMDDFERLFLQGTNPVERVIVTAGDVEVGREDYALWFDYEKALLLAWQRWPEAKIEQSIRRGIASLKPLFLSGGLGKAADIPDDVTYPWVSSDITPTPAPPPEDERIIILAELDLYVLDALAAFDADFARYYESWLATASSSIAAVGAPFPAYAVWAADDAYFNGLGDNFSVSAETVLTTLLSLAECGVKPEASLDFFRQALLDGRVLNQHYRFSDGAPGGEPAFADLYALAARLGRAAGDDLLAELAISALNRFYASSQTSLIFGAMFRDAPDNGFDMMLNDNARAILALH